MGIQFSNTIALLIWYTSYYIPVCWPCFKSSCFPAKKYYYVVPYWDCTLQFHHCLLQALCSLLALYRKFKSPAFSVTQVLPVIKMRKFGITTAAASAIY